MPRSNINGAQVHYQQAGRGPDLVLIHGLFCNLAFWYLTLVPQLAKRFRVTVYDLRGHGYSERTPKGYRPVDLAGDLHALLNHLGIERAHFLGHSFGGAVALAFTTSYPNRVSSLMLADVWVPSLQPLDSEFWRRQRESLSAKGVVVGESIPRVAYSFYEELMEEPEMQDTSTGIDPSLFSMFRPGGADAPVLRKWRRLIETTEAVKELTDEVGLSQPALEKIDHRTLAIFGRRSRYLLTMRRLRTLLKRCNVIVLPNAGHFSIVLRPRRLIRIVNRFVAQDQSDASVMAGDPAAIARRGIVG